MLFFSLMGVRLHDLEAEIYLIPCSWFFANGEHGFLRVILHVKEWDYVRVCLDKKVMGMHSLFLSWLVAC